MRGHDESIDRHIDDSMLIILPEASHLSNIEQDETFNRPFVSF